MCSTHFQLPMKQHQFLSSSIANFNQLIKEYLFKIYTLFVLDYMNPSTSSAFGGSCGDVVQDASVYVNSHINPLKWFNYGENKDCVMTLDAGSMGGAL